MATAPRMKSGGHRPRSSSRCPMGNEMRRKVYVLLAVGYITMAVFHFLERGSAFEVSVLIGIALLLAR